MFSITIQVCASVDPVNAILTKRITPVPHNHIVQLWLITGDLHTNWAKNHKNHRMFSLHDIFLYFWEGLFKATVPDSSSQTTCSNLQCTQQETWPELSLLTAIPEVLNCPLPSDNSHHQVTPEMLACATYSDGKTTSCQEDLFRFFYLNLKTGSAVINRWIMNSLPSVMYPGVAQPLGTFVIHWRILYPLGSPIMMPWVPHRPSVMMPGVVGSLPSFKRPVACIAMFNHSPT